MTTIYLIRHTQAEGNLYRMMQGHWNGGVTELGFRQIDALAERFADTHLDAVYSSDLYRAMITASGLTRGRDLQIITDKRLREINVGPWETKFFGNVVHEQPDSINTFIFDSESWKIDGAETFDEVRRRSFSALTEIAEKNDGKDIAVVTHGVTTRCILSAVMHIPLNDPKAIPIMKNTVVTKLVFENGQFKIEYMNDSTHLGDGELAVWNNVKDLRDEPLDIESDTQYYLHCYKDAWKAAHGTYPSDEYAGYFLKTAAEHNRKFPGSVMRILSGDESVGLVDLDCERGIEDGIGWISLLYLKDSFRGTGHGVQLLARAFFFYQGLNRSAVRLFAAEDNTAALGFYKKNGFYEIGKRAGAAGPLLLMERKLGGVSFVPSESSGNN